MGEGGKRLTTNKYTTKAICILIFKFLMLLYELEFKEICLPKKNVVSPGGVGVQVAQRITKRACIFRFVTFLHCYTFGNFKKPYCLCK